jgi:hypothetical protein
LVLHVATELYPTGGHTRLLWRWIAQDPSHRHDVVLTRSRNGYIPPELAEAVEASGGTITSIGPSTGIHAAARKLRRISSHAKAVLLHDHPFDVCAYLAFRGDPLTPVALVNHADHGFWVGVGVAQSVVNFREGGEALCETRRGIASARSIRICLPLDLSTSSFGVDRSAAKASLGLSPDTVVLLSVGAIQKFGHGYDQPSVLELVEPVLLQEPQAMFIALGAGDSSRWRRAHARTGGRVQSLPPSEQIAVYYAAADIYLDTFPMTSPTALLECGAQGVPALAFTPHQREARAYSCDAPGTGPVRRAASAEAYRDSLRHLIRSDRARTEAGDALQQSIVAQYASNPVPDHLRQVYAHLFRRGPSPAENATYRPNTPLDAADLYLLQYHLAGGFCRSLGDLVVNYADGLGPHARAVRFSALLHSKWARLMPRPGGSLNLVMAMCARFVARADERNLVSTDAPVGR